jgi:hypothetical protein
MAQQLLQTENYWQKKFHVSSHYDTFILTINTDETIFKASIADGKMIWRKPSSKKVLLW